MDNVDSLPKIEDKIGQRLRRAVFLLRAARNLYSTTPHKSVEVFNNWRLAVDEFLDGIEQDCPTPGKEDKLGLTTDTAGLGE